MYICLYKTIANLSATYFGSSTWCLFCLLLSLSGSFQTSPAITNRTHWSCLKFCQNKKFSKLPSPCFGSHTCIGTAEFAQSHETHLYAALKSLKSWKARGVERGMEFSKIFIRFGIGPPCRNTSFTTVSQLPFAFYNDLADNCRLSV